MVENRITVIHLSTVLKHTNKPINKNKSFNQVSRRETGCETDMGQGCWRLGIQGEVKSGRVQIIRAMRVGVGRNEFLLVNKQKDGIWDLRSNREKSGGFVGLSFGATN